MRQHLIRHGTLAALCAVAALGLTACQDKGGDSGASTPAATAHPSAKATASATPRLLTGSELTKALAPASLFSPGLAVDPSATRDTGDGYAASSTKDVPKPDCTLLDTTGWIGITGITGVSFTQQDRVDNNTSTEVAQGIDVFPGTTSATVLTALSKVSTVCPSFTDSQTHSLVKVTEHALPGMGDGAYVITLTSSGWQSGSTLVAARVGTAVISVLSNDGARNGGVAASKVARHIAAGLKGRA